MLTTCFVYITVLLIGISGGCTGTGGVILVPLLIYVDGMTSHVAMGTALFSFIFTSSLSAWLFARKGDMDWPAVFYMSLGAIPCSYAGALVKAHLNGELLNLILALVIIAACWCAFIPTRARAMDFMHTNGPARKSALIVVGALSGVVTGLTGVGGGTLSISLLLLLGVAPLTVVAVAQAFGFMSTIAGTIGNVQNHAVDFNTGFILAVLQIIGLLWGVRLAHTLNTSHLRMAVLTLCVATALFILGASVRDILYVHS